MIKKSELKNKNVSYVDKQGAFRSGKVLRISGNTLTVGTRVTINKKSFILNKERIHPDTEKIYGVYYRNKIVEIDWGRGA